MIIMFITRIQVIYRVHDVCSLQYLRPTRRIGGTRSQI